MSLQIISLQSGLQMSLIFYFLLLIIYVLIAKHRTLQQTSLSSLDCKMKLSQIKVAGMLNRVYIQFGQPGITSGLNLGFVVVFHSTHSYCTKKVPRTL